MKTVVNTRAALTLMVILLFGPAMLDLHAQSMLTLTEGTPVRVRLIETLDTGTRLEAGSAVAFEVADPVIVSGVTVIRPGARAFGTITEARKAKWGGRKGKLDFTIDYVEAVDGQNIRLRSIPLKERGRGNVGLMAATVALVSPVGLIIRGKNAVVEKGSEFSVFIDQERTIQLQGPQGTFTSLQ